MRPTARFNSLCRNESGSAAIEFALVAMMTICLFLGIVEFGRALYMRNEMAFAADLAARRILINSAVTDSELETTIRSSTTFNVPDEMQLTFGTEIVDGVPFRKVSLSQRHTLLIPNLSNAGIVLTIARRVPLT